MPTMREQVSELLRNNAEADYWEKLVLRLAEALLARVDRDLRGIPIAEAGLEPMRFEDYENLPAGSIELLDGVPTPKGWTIAIEARRRLGFKTYAEETAIWDTNDMKEAKAEYDRRRAALRARPFVPSQVPFPSGPPEE